MSAAEQLAPLITAQMTWREICERYPDQWVCVVEIEWDEPRSFDFRNARVVGHGVTRREPLDQARVWREQYREMGHFYTGKIKAPTPRFSA